MNGNEQLITLSLRNIGIVPADERGDFLGELALDDGSDDFDFVSLESRGSVFDRLVFRSHDRLDGPLPTGPDIWVERTDTWLSNEREVAAGTGPWDPDTDDDGLTDGQEIEGVTVARPGVGAVQYVIHRDRDASYETNATDPDTDGDGYWDGWVGVYGVGRSDNVILYMEHLQTGDGIEGSEIVQEQTGVHPVNTNASTAAAMGARLYANRDRKYHSNLHLGERHWDTDPTIEGSTPDTRLDIEVDYLPGENPFTITRGRGANVTSAIERNMRLYGLEIEFHESDRIPRSRLRTISKNPLGRSPTITPHGFNQWELMIVEDRFHDNESRLHAFWGSRIRDDFPKSAIDT